MQERISRYLPRRHAIAQIQFPTSPIPTNTAETVMTSGSMSPNTAIVSGIAATTATASNMKFAIRILLISSSVSSARRPLHGNCKRSPSAPVRAVEAHGIAANFAQGDSFARARLIERAPTRSSTAWELHSAAPPSAGLCPVRRHKRESDRPQAGRFRVYQKYLLIPSLTFSSGALIMTVNCTPFSVRNFSSQSRNSAQCSGSLSPATL